MSVTVRSLAEFRALLSDLPGANAEAAAAAAAREPQLTKPVGSLGRLEQLVEWLAAWQGRHPARMDTVRTCVFAGNHGVAALGVSAFPASVTAQMVANFEAGGAAVNQLCGVIGAELTVTPLDLDRPTADFTKGPAMSEDEVVAALNVGLQAVAAAPPTPCVLARWALPTPPAPPPSRWPCLAGPRLTGRDRARVCKVMPFRTRQGWWPIPWLPIRRTDQTAWRFCGVSVDGNWPPSRGPLSGRA